MAGKQGPKDLNENAFRVVSEAIGESPKTQPQAKDEAAVERGKARASKLSASRRHEIAAMAAKARWGG